MRAQATLLLIATILAACSQERGQSRSTNEGGVASETWAGTAMLTERTGEAARVIPEGVSLETGRHLSLEADLSHAPAGTSVRVLWISPDGTVKGQELRVARMDRDRLRFAAPNTAHWPAGLYRVQLYMAGKRVHESTFHIGAS